jgi:hypothetical protein
MGRILALARQEIWRLSRGMSEMSVLMLQRKACLSKHFFFHESAEVAPVMMLTIFRRPLTSLLYFMIQNCSL